MAHFLSPPFGLPGARDARLLRHLEEDDWASAITLLRDVVTAETAAWKPLVLLAYCRFRDAADVLPDELTAASREALTLLDRAMQHGAPLDELAPFREAVERTLDQLSRGEEALLSRLGPGDEAASLTLDELEHAAFLVQRAQPERAARLFTTLAQRHAASDEPRATADALVVLNSTRAALALVQAGKFDAARPALEAALQQDWAKKPLQQERLTLEAVETALLEHAAGADFDAQWRLAEARGQAVAFPFPAAWPHQERLFERCVAVRDVARARALAQRIEDERPEVAEALAQRLAAARYEQA